MSATAGLAVAVAGGTGVVGTHVVDAARRRGHRVRVLSRSNGVDLAGAGPPDLAGIEVVIDVASVATGSARASRAFFGSVTRNLVAAGRAAGVRHHIALSVVGIESVPGGYYAGKLLQERLLRESGVGWTLLRATQFHEFARQGHGQVRVGPWRVVPAMTAQPVAAAEVAERLVALAEAGPAGRVPDLGGPQRLRTVDMLRAYSATTDRPARFVSVPVPGRVGRALREGALTCGDGADRGALTFEAWLDGLHESAAR